MYDTPQLTLSRPLALGTMRPVMRPPLELHVMIPSCNARMLCIVCFAALEVLSVLAWPALRLFEASAKFREVSVQREPLSVVQQREPRTQARSPVQTSETRDMLDHM